MDLINLDYLKNYVVNEEFYELCLSDEKKAERFLSIANKKVLAYIDIEQFKDGDGYNIPEDLQDTVRYLVESLYLNRNINSSAGMVTSYTEKFDDYSLAKQYNTSGILLWSGIPIIKEYLDILNKYRGGNIISFSGYFKV